MTGNEYQLILRNLELARPSNVVNVNNVSNQFTLKERAIQQHSLKKLVEFFVKSFSNEGDLIVGLLCWKWEQLGLRFALDTNRKYLLN